MEVPPSFPELHLAAEATPGLVHTHVASLAPSVSLGLGGGQKAHEPVR